MHTDFPCKVRMNVCTLMVCLTSRPINSPKNLSHSILHYILRGKIEVELATQCYWLHRYYTDNEALNLATLVGLIAIRL
jgi:hypothetical protein